MNYYIGVKSIKAKEMTLGEYNVYRGWTLPENEDPNAKGFLVEYEQDPVTPNQNHPDHDGYISWSPRSVFEKAYLLEKAPLEIEAVNRAPHQERVVDEYNELLKKSNALSSFFDLPLFATLSEDEKSRLKNQSMVMKAYLSILASRIENF